MVDIRNFDHDIQSLVFENYTKFISSVETVKKMRQSIMKVDDKLKQMESSMKSINDLATKIDTNFKVKRGEIQKLTTINKELQKVAHHFEYP